MWSRLLTARGDRYRTRDGAERLGVLDRVGTLEPGNQADLVVVRGRPDPRVADVGNVEIVFRADIGFDPEKLLASVLGQVGIR